METTLDLHAHEALNRHFVGRQVRIPRDPVRLQRKSDDLSADDAKRICEAFGGCRIWGRKPTRLLAEARNDRIQVRRKHGATIAELAEEFALSERQIQNILRNYPNA